MRIHRHNVVLALFVGLLAVVSVSLEEPGPIQREMRRLFPEFYLDRAERVVLEQGEARLTLERDSRGDWAIQELFGYPARSAYIDSLLVRAGSVQNHDLVSTRADQHREYGVSGEGVRVQVLDAQGAALADYLQGHALTGTPGSYVRLSDSDEVYRAVGLRSLQPDAATLLESNLLRIDPISVRRLTLALGDQPEKSFTRVEGSTDRWRGEGGATAESPRLELFLADLNRVFVDGVAAGEPLPEVESRPLLRVGLDLVDGGEIDLRLGGVQEDGRVLATRSDRPFTVQLDAGTRERLEELLGSLSR